MPHFVFERHCQTRVCRVWKVSQGAPPELVAPLRTHRQRFGDLYNWGAGTDGCRLLAATLLHRAGLSAPIARLLAPDMVSELLLHRNDDVWRIDVSELAKIVVGLCERCEDRIRSYYMGWERSHVQN